MPPLPQQEPTPQAPPALQSTPAPTQSRPQAPPQPKQQTLDWNAQVPAIAQKYGLQEDLIRRVIKAESSGNPLAISPKGARGLMQLMPPTAQRLGVNPDDPLQNLDGGARELKRLLDKYQHYGKALAAYNWGEDKVDRLASQPGGFANLPPETQKYINDIMDGYVPPQKGLAQMGTPEAPKGWLDTGKGILEALKGGFTAPGTLFGPPTAQQQQGQQDLQTGVKESQAWFAQHPEAQQANEAGRLWGFLPPLGGYQMPPEEAAPHLAAYWKNPTAANLRAIPEEKPFSPVGAGMVSPGTISGGVAEGIAGLASPANISQLAAVPINKLINLFYTGMMGKDTAQLLYQAKQQEAAGNHQAAHELYGNAIVTGGMTLLTALGLRPERTTGAAETVDTGVRPGPRDVSAQPGAGPQGQEPARVQVGARQEPSMAQEGGPRPITSPGISGGREIGGQHPASGVSAPIEGGGGTTGTVTPKPTGRELTPVGPSGIPPSGSVQEAVGRARQEGLMPDRRVRTEDWTEQERRRAPMQGRPTAEDIIQQQRTQAAQATEAKRQAFEAQTAAERAQKGGAVVIPPAQKGYKSLPPDQRPRVAAESLKETSDVQRPTGLAQAPAPAAPIGAAGSIRADRSDQKPPDQAGQPLRSVQEPVREPLRPQQVAPTPQPLGEEPRIKPGMSLEQKQQVARDRNAWLKQRSVQQPRLEPTRLPADSLHRTVTRFLKSTDEARPGRYDELSGAIDRERAKSPEERKNALQAMLDRAEYAEGASKGLDRLLKAQDFDKELSSQLSEPLIPAGEVNADTGQFERARGPWVGERGIKGGRPGPSFTSPIEAITREIFNDLRGNQTREVGKPMPGLDEATTQKLADLQKEYSELLKTVKAQEGMRPSDEQLAKLKDLMQGIHVLRGTRRIATPAYGVKGEFSRENMELGPKGEPLPAGTAAKMSYLKALMGWSDKGHTAKPSNDMLKARLNELQQEAVTARYVAKMLGAEAPTATAMPKTEVPLKGAGVPAPRMQEAIRREISKPHVERPTEAAPAAGERQAFIDKIVEGDVKEGFSREEALTNAQKMAEKRFGPATEASKETAKAPERPVEAPKPPTKSEVAKAALEAPKTAPAAKPEAVITQPKALGYKSGQARPAEAPESPRTPAQQLEKLVGEERPKPSPQAQVRYEAAREKVVEQYAADRAAHNAKKDEVKALRSVDPKDYTPEFVDRLTKYGQGLKDIEGKNDFLAKVAEARSAFMRGDDKAGSAAVQTALAMADQRLIEPRPGKMPLEPGTTSPSVEPQRASKSAGPRDRLADLDGRIAKLPEGQDRNNLAKRHASISGRFEELTEKLKYDMRHIEAMKKAGESERTFVPKKGPRAGQKVTETLEQLEARVRTLGKERADLVSDQIPGLAAAIKAFETAPVPKAPAPVPTKIEPTVMPTYGPAEVVREPQTGKYVGTIPGERTGEKVVLPSPAPREEGVQARLDELKRQESHLANMQQKFGQQPNRSVAIQMSKLQKSIKAIRASLGKDAPASAERVASTLYGTELLRRAEQATPRPKTEAFVVPPAERGFVSGAPRGEGAEALHSWLKGKFESIPPAVMKFIDNTLSKAGVAGDYIANPIMEALQKGEFGDLTGDEAPAKAAIRLQRALDVLSEGRVKSLSAPEGERNAVRAKAFADAVGVAKTGSLPIAKPKEGQAGFLSFGRKGAGAVPAGRAAQVSRNAIGRLAQAIKALPASRSMDTRIQNALKASQTAVKTTPNSFARAYTQTVALSKSLLNSFRALPKWTDFEKSLGDFRLIKARQAYESRNFVKALQDKLGVPSLLRQTISPRKASAETKAAHLRLEAITNYLETGGDKAELARRASLSSKEHRAAYELASKLNPEEEAIAEAIKAHFESRAKDGWALGILQGAVENYAPHIWKDKGFLGNLYSEMNSGILNRNFKFAMQRIYGSFFEGEQRGLVPKTKRIDALVAIHDQAFNTAMNTRLLARQLFDGTGEDGRPILAVNKGGAIRLTGGQKLDPVRMKMIQRNPAILLKPHGRPFADDLDMSGYRQIPHSAFQQWMWKASEGGKSIMMQSDAWVHPDFYKRLDNLVGKSLIREYTVGRALLKGTAVLKQSVLGGIGAFHYVQEGLHSVWHLQNPLNKDIWTGERLNRAMTDPVVLEGVRHGLVLYDGNTAAELGEGLGVMDKIPGLGKYVRASTEHLFKTFIPSLKADLYKHVWDKNQTRYAADLRSGKVSAEQLKSFSARTVNNAFGELDSLTRNKTFQDIFRLGFLAPDFLEARARFLGQAVRPYGWVPFTAALRNLTMLYAAARISNQVINGDPLWDGKYWDAVKIGDKAYRLRSLMGDLFHASTDPANFLYWRLSPFARPVVGAMAAQRKGLPYRLKDAFTDVVPIPLQGAVRELIGNQIHDPGVARSLWETFGVHQEKYFTPYQRRAMQQRAEQRERALRGEKRQGLGPLLPSLPRVR